MQGQGWAEVGRVGNQLNKCPFRKLSCAHQEQVQAQGLDSLRRGSDGAKAAPGNS